MVRLTMLTIVVILYYFSNFSSIASLYKWRYKNLGNLPHVLTNEEYQLANPGFAFEYQVINVKDYNGAGETEPSPYFFQV